MSVRDNIVGITEETIIIPGLSREYKLVHFSDVHVISSYENEAPEVKEATVGRVPFFFATQEASIDRWFSLTEEANKINPDAVVLTGDIIDFPSCRNLDVLDEGLKRLNAPYVYCVGNHDWSFGYNYHTKNSIETELPLFQKYMNGEKSAYSILDLGEFAIIALNNSMEQIEPEALEGLKKAFALKKPIIIAMHIPLCADNYPENTLRADTCEYWSNYICIGENGIKPNATSSEFIELATSEDSPVAAILTGHIHFAHKDKINSRVNQYVCCRGTEGSYTILTVKGQ